MSNPVEISSHEDINCDGRRRVRLPKSKAGQVFAYELNLDGTIKLIPIPNPGQKWVVAKLVKGGGGLFFQIPDGYTLGYEAIGNAVAKECDSRS